MDEASNPGASIEQHFGTRQFARLRVGIGRTERGLREITGHVLGKFSAEEAEILAMVWHDSKSEPPGIWRGTGCSTANHDQQETFR